ncbi:hypothetical protein CRI94_12475 [Longibacter salinarum]|uniref:Sulfotransferase family protein n=1 Tax=Longibacter salinarum TaxID=1850348 RepID=A0A2A8CVS5_9BACT|nr:sulfotransferase [Longibacter salinarum]PEN12815.1 hypothetical protein CRI94_12475 [Longibacter salinarum]
MSIDPTSIESWVFVTGMIRSGTTFLASVLSHPVSVDYIHEPFNGGYTIPEGIALKARYVDKNDHSHAARRYRDHVRHIFTYDIGMSSAKYDDDPLARKVAKRLFGSRGPFYLRLAKANWFRRHALIKDPMAGLTTDFLYREFGVKPVVIVRHPVSLAASLKRLSWFPEVYDFALQPDVIANHLEDDLHLLHTNWEDRLLESMAHWRMLYRVLLDQAEKHGDWIVVTHEELSSHPVRVFRRIYRECGLPWSDGVHKKILSLTTNNGKAYASDGRVQDFKRDSASIFEMRRDSVPLNTRRDIFEITSEIALRIYDRESFKLGDLTPS